MTIEEHICDHDAHEWVSMTQCRFCGVWFDPPGRTPANTITPAFRKLYEEGLRAALELNEQAHKNLLEIHKHTEDGSGEERPASTPPGSEG